MAIIEGLILAGCDVRASRGTIQYRRPSVYNMAVPTPWMILLKRSAFQ